jgi:hypothetical protein
MPADGAIDSHFVYDGDLEGLLLSCVAGLST